MAVIMTCVVLTGCNVTRTVITESQCYQRGETPPHMAKAKIGAAGIEYIQGALKKPKKVNGHNHADQAAFYAQKENGIPTFKAYIWSLEKARYDEQHG